MDKRFTGLLHQLGCLLFCVISTIPQLFAQTGNTLAPVINNYTTFSQVQKSAARPVLTNNVGASLQNMDALNAGATEVVEKRTANSKYFIDKRDPHKFYQLFSYGGDLHYKKNGQLLTIDARLKPMGAGIYKAAGQQEPVGFDINKRSAFIESTAGKVSFNNWTLTGIKSGKKLTLAHADWSRFTAGDDGVRVYDIFPGIDAEMKVARGSIKTNFIIRKDLFPNVDRFIFNDHFGSAAEGGKLQLTAGPEAHGTATYLLNGQAAIRINRAIAYPERSATQNFEYLDHSITGNTLSFGVDAAYITKYLAAGNVIIDPLVTTTGTLAQNLITGSQNCGTYLAPCVYQFTVPTPAQATFTNVYFQFGYYASAPAGENNGHFVIKTGSCTSGDYSVVNPTVNTGPGTVTTHGAFAPITSLVNCLPAPSCNSQTVPFEFDFYNTYCGGDNTCSSTYVEASEPLVIEIEGHTVELGAMTQPVTICNGSSATISASGQYGVPPYNYAWSNGATTNNINVSPAATTTYSVVITDGCGNTATGSTTVTVNPIPVAGPVTSNSPVCSGSQLNLSTPVVSGATYSWTGPGGFTSTLSNPSITNAASSQSGLYSVTITVNGCTSPPVKTTVEIDVPSTPSVSITSSASAAVCAGANVTFTATPVNGGNNPLYQWLLNGNKTGTNAATYSSTTLANNDVVSCVLTSSAACTTQPTATSNSITTTVNPIVTPSVSIVANTAATICAGTTVIVTATPVNGGTAPAYQWTLNGAATNTTTATYTSSTLNNNDVLSCTLTSNAICTSVNTASSNTIKFTVVPVVTPLVSITASANSICPGTQVIFTATPVNGGTSPAYQWQVNGANAGTNSTGFTSTTLNNNDVVSCILTSSVTCVTMPTATSNLITMEVSTPVTPAVNIAASATTICAGTTVNFTATAINGGATPSFQWKLNGANTGTNSNTYSSGILNNNDVISCVLTSSIGCVTASTATSANITMVVNPVLTPSVNIAASDASVCKGTPVIFIASAVNCGTVPQYDWLLNGNSTGTTNASYTNAALTQGDIVSCRVTPQNPGCYASAAAISNNISITVNDIPIVSAGRDTTVFKGASFVLGGSATGTIAAYQWSPAIYLSSSTTASPVITPLATTTYTLQATSTGSCSASASVTVTVLTQIIIPNTFTPNGDGINDTWRIAGLKDYPGAVINVYDRYGQMVFNALTYKDWDGTQNGKPLPSGTYYYIIDPKNKMALLSGWVVILR